jgi:hypothetical protein
MELLPIRGGLGLIFLASGQAQVFLGLKNLLKKLGLNTGSGFTTHLNEKVGLRLWVICSKMPNPNLQARAQARPTSTSNGVVDFQLNQIF